ncbi:MAG: glycosyltransferase family 4 protein [Acidimicrobiia bacterium]
MPVPEVRRHLLLTNDFPPRDGGIQTLLWELWRRLPPDRFAVLTTAQPGSAGFDAAQPFRIERAGRVLLPTPALRRRAVALADEVGAELVVVDPVLPVGALGPWLGRPYAVVMHGSELVGRVPGLDRAVGRLLRQASRVVAAGTYPAGETARLAGPAGPPVSVVPCGVDTDRFRPLDPAGKAAARRRFGLPAEGALVVGVSRLVPRKGFDVLIEAVGRLEGVHLAIGSDGRDRRRLERLAGDRVTFLGRVDDADLPALYACGDAFAMLCRDRWGGLEREGFGIVFLEAAACGVPQLAGRSGGSADAVLDGETGVVLDDPRSVAAAVDGLRRVLDPSLAPAMGAESRRRAVERFDYDRLAAELAAALA